VKDTTNSGQGYYAGIFESGPQPEPPLNDVLTGNTKGLILEILYYKVRGSQPLLTHGQFAPLGTPSTSSEAAVPIPGPPAKPFTPLRQPHANLDSLWWQTIRRGDTHHRGLPSSAVVPVQRVTTDAGTYWVPARASS
jgi:hypothetical protein